jgi:hypothetical protein
MSSSSHDTESERVLYGFPLSELATLPSRNVGRTGFASGYIVEFSPDTPGANRWGWIQQHRLVSQLAIGRQLTRSEVVHHEDEDRANNSLENLWLFPNQAAHLRHHKRKSPRYDRVLAERLLPLAQDPSVPLEKAAELLGVSLSTVRALLSVHSIQWRSPAVRELDEQTVREALQGRSTLEAATLLGIGHMTLRRRFPFLLQTRASPGFLDGLASEIQSLAKSTRVDVLAERFGCHPTTLRTFLRRKAKEEPDGWLEIAEFQRLRLGTRKSRQRKA